ncbi:hypothetical protein HanXRQr2_Chr01g0012911 [Helianthus annuus]|uniref:Uncharacterized protein n=1 Tax=Helianthus annuus TaxID=4232 RepID=A0A251VM65_HELAN|nr:probable glycosyltransferase STELLO1 [Helianthus annuus]KAF5821350.1 hypothetical protein HanXRQr2_Chr01g0012911 [Helianthus annuus]KAJ0611026.1 hypothetical protein HanHA300_Chr01g0010521 [Helianthus annuus]KAJ0626296.1 hypothetical protein HanHA89_Chr01g0011531 [Helianthus annuus]KAJ0782635.1 hypothetical protein HanLR1_Chr01g0010501 [Helianthus annuus]
MLVQQDNPKPQNPKSPKFHPNRFSPSKSLDFSTWVSQNLYKIITISILITTVAAVFFLRTTGDSAAFLCFRSQTTTPQTLTLKYPQIDYDSIAPIVDNTTPYSRFRSDNWVIVSVSDYPSNSVKKLLKIKGWQVLAVGNSKTPDDWSLKGTIFLSLEDQAKLGFRVVDYLPYDSYVRKNVGYLFAIQHGAKKIFDFDDRGELIDDNISKHFDIELGEKGRKDVVLQYNRDNPNRTVVNPYIHFGQRSVWPRGLPLENVGEIEHEEHYNEVFSGNQFIQQGISNGLPDVDSVFYFTRKQNREPFDIKFDQHAPKVALPEGVMVPVNSFNTMFHYSSFWGLMLPVSVSSMASDVIRGYWAQRLLWEIGGYVVVYPPTVHRYDSVESYPFAEEKDLHVNVGNLVHFLVSWKSSKRRLFEKVLELSYSMAKEGFWSEKDVKFTAAWIQDLISVGYLQPRLISVESRRRKSVINHGERKDFVPQKLPSVFLGIEEKNTVNYEIGNLVRWRKNFGNIVLIMFCNGPIERTALEWRLLYGRIFKSVIILAENKNLDLVVEEGHFDHLYKQLPRLFNRFENAEGFLFLQDNTILNYWNLVQADKTKLWITDKVSRSWSTVPYDGNKDWYGKQAEMVKKVVKSMPAHLQVNYKDHTNNHDSSLTICTSDVFYIPQRLVVDFIDLVNLVEDLEIHQKVAIPMFFLAMDSPQNFDSVFSKMVYKRKPPLNITTSFYSPEVSAVHPLRVSNEQEFIELIRVMAAGDPLLLDLV